MGSVREGMLIEQTCDSYSQSSMIVDGNFYLLVIRLSLFSNFRIIEELNTNIKSKKIGYRENLSS